jgi:hypothetical protein
VMSELALVGICGITWRFWKFRKKDSVPLCLRGEHVLP